MLLPVSTDPYYNCNRFTDTLCWTVSGQSTWAPLIAKRLLQPVSTDPYYNCTSFLDTLFWTVSGWLGWAPLIAKRLLQPVSTDPYYNCNRFADTLCWTVSTQRLSPPPLPRQTSGLYPSPSVFASASAVTQAGDSATAGTRPHTPSAHEPPASRQLAVSTATDVHMSC